MKKSLLLNVLVTASLCCGQTTAQKVAAATSTDTLNITVTTPGAMGDSILAKVEYFSDVTNIKISGTLNDDDLATLKNRLSNVVYLDMGDVKLTEIPYQFFYGKKVVKKIILPTTLETIGESAFYECSDLTQVVFPSSLKTINRYSFYRCTSLQQVVLPEGLTSMGEQTFDYCTSNKYIKLPSTLKSIKEYTFYNNEALEKIDFSDGLTEIANYAFYECKSLQSLEFPSSLYSIDNYAFAYNDKLASITFNEGLYRIGDDAFYQCTSLKELTLPSSLVIAREDPFSYCKNITKITCLSIAPPYVGTSSYSQILYGCETTGRELYVPALSINSYKQTVGWDKFPTIKPIDYLPENITVLDNLHLTLPESMSASYKPTVSLVHDSKNNNSYYEYGSLTVNGEGTLSMSKFSTVWDPNYDRYYTDRTNYCSLINNSHLRSDSIAITLYTPLYYWTFVSFPFDVKVSDIETTESGTTSYVIRKYDGLARANGETDSTWVKMTADSTLHAGIGYIIQGRRYYENNTQDYSGFRIKAINNANKNKIFIATDAVVTLADYPSEFAHNRSWNLIGNPYPCYYDIRFMDTTVPITIWDINNRTYNAYSPVDDSYILRPGEAFFVQRPVEVASITFDKTGRQTDKTIRTIEQAKAKAASATPATRRTIINLTLTNGNNNDKTRIVLNEAAQLSYEMDKDAPKFLSTNTDVPQIFTTLNGVDYAINERPMEDGKVNLSIRAKSDGINTLSLAKDVDNYTIMLEDKEASKTINMSEVGEYVFTTTTDDVSSRFVLHIIDGTITGINSIKSDLNDDSTYYSVEGTKVVKPSKKGVYIKNNKKVVIK